MKSAIILLSALFFISCGNYSFSGKSIPPGIDNAQLNVFEDNSGRYDLNLPDIIDEKVAEYIEDYKYFELENSSEADSKIFGTITNYSEKTASQDRNEISDRMLITISVRVNFQNLLNDEFIVRDLNVSETEYFESSGGDIARDEAFNTLIDRLSENIVLGLSSNW
ncbi:MAG: hypothetical protein R6V47_00770 [Candidatus Delongbacteria bacterium]